MRHGIRQYATALRQVLEHTDQDARKAVLGRFATLLERNRDWSKLNRILAEVERQERINAGMEKVRIESAEPVTATLRRRIQEIFQHKAILEEAVLPKLLAGVRLLIEDETLIDASGKRRLDGMFQK